MRFQKKEPPLAENVLGFKPHDIPLLLKAGLLKPLGQPMPNGDKHFATVTLTELRQDVQWLSKATIAVSQHWKQKNAQDQRRAEWPSPVQCCDGRES